MDTVLIVGAGPTGLTLGCELAWRRVPVRIVDARPQPSRHSKAIGVFPRTLELLENHGLAADTVEGGVRIRGIDIHAGKKRLARIDTSRIDSRYDYILTVEQSVTERLLIRRLEALGVRVERPVEVVDLRQEGDAVDVVLERAPEGENAQREMLTVPWAVGCDGGRSFVRDTVGIPFGGEPYQEAFDLADVELESDMPGARDRINLFLSPKGVMFAAPLDGGKHRLIVDEPPGSAGERRLDPTLADFRGWWLERVEYGPARGAEISNPGWLSRFKIQRRVASRAREGRVLLAGDAMHVHSPAGAQGMNGGIQDAVNLGWKLALVAQGRAPETLLDSYGEERLPVASAVLKATHASTVVLTSRSRPVRFARDRAMSLALRSAALQERAVNAAAELRVNYRTSPIVHENDANGGGTRTFRAPTRRVAAGDRAPDGPLAGPGRTRLYDAMRHPDHTLLVFAGERASAENLRRANETARLVEGRYSGLIRTHVLVGETAAGQDRPEAALLDPAGWAHARYGLREGGVCLVRSRPLRGLPRGRARPC